MLDHPDHRKLHQEATPLLGGAAVFSGFLAALFHNSEKFNRTVVGLATFDLAYEKYAGGRDRVRELAETGGTNLNAYNLAIEEAKYMMYKTLGDFTPSGKAQTLR